VARLVSTVLGLGLVLLASCGGTTEIHADPVPDVHVTVILHTNRESGNCCLVTVVNPSDREVNAYCRIRARDSNGAVIFDGPIPSGPAGFFAKPGVTRNYGSSLVPIRLSKVTYKTHCNSVDWHGQPPI
jgi:hypothetical protein